MNVKYFVVSLPRTGTTSLSKMARICGLNAKHVPHKYWKNYIDNNVFNFFSDTPIYDPTIVEQICSMDVVNSRFIYVNKDFTEVFNSWKRMGLLRNYENFYGNEQNFDFISYDNAFDNNRMSEINYHEIFNNHKNKVLNIIEKHNKNILIYNFEDGWKPFCDFLGCDIPNEKIPKLNTNSFFEKY